MHNVDYNPKYSISFPADTYVPLPNHTVRNIDLPDGKTDNKGKTAFIIENVYSNDECNEFIKMFDDCGYIQAKVGKSDILDQTYRKSLRCMVKSTTIASNLFHRIKNHLPNKFETRTLSRIDPLFRSLKYNKGDFFLPHYDESVCINGEISKYTILLYLSDYDKTNGGETVFVSIPSSDNSSNNVAVEYKKGDVLVFDHTIYHEGKLYSGTGNKICVRTNVLYAF